MPAAAIPWIAAAASAAGGAIAGASDDVTKTSGKSWIDLLPAGATEKKFFGTPAKKKIVANPARAEWLHKQAAIVKKGQDMGYRRGDLGWHTAGLETEIMGLGPAPLETMEIDDPDQPGTPGKLENLFDQLNAFMEQGPGEHELAKSREATSALSAMLQEYARTGGVPTADDIGRARGYTDSIFAPRRTALNQSFARGRTDMERLSARLGRPVNDPILNAKLIRGQAEQTDLLEADAGAATSEYANALPTARLGYQRANADLYQRLADQAWRNRMTILGLGSDLGSAERQFRVSTSPQYTSGENVNPGSLTKAISGGLGGFGQGLGMGSMFAGGFGGGAAPWTTAAQGADGVVGWGPTAPGSKSGWGGTGSYYAPTRFMPGYAGQR